VEIEFELTEDDLVAFNRCQRRLRMRRAREDGRRNRPSVWAALAFGLVVAALTVLTDSVWLVLEYAGLILLGAVLTVAWALTVSRPRRLVQRTLSQGRNVRVLKRRKVAISPAGVRTVSSDSDCHNAWSGIDWIEVTDEHAFVFLNTEQAIIIPQEAFRTDEEFHEFVAQARRWHDAAALQPLSEFRTRSASEKIEKE
jgi:hypothetical protein